MAIEFTARLREPDYEHLELKVFAATHADAASVAMNHWLATGAFGAEQFSTEVVTTTTLIEPHAARFQFELPPAFLMEPVHCCKQCGCTDEDACDPPCSWVSDDVCSACAATVRP